MKQLKLLALLPAFVLAALSACTSGSGQPASTGSPPIPVTLPDDTAVPATIPHTPEQTLVPTVTALTSATAVPIIATVSQPAGDSTCGGCVTPAVPPQRIEFQPGRISEIVDGVLQPGQQDTYLFRSLAGQMVMVELRSIAGRANFTLSGVDDGRPYKDLDNEERLWRAPLPLTQDYWLTVTVPVNAPVTEYSLELLIEPIVAAPPPASASIRGLVWQDNNRDDHFTDDEPLEGMDVLLLGGIACNEQIGHTTTVVGGAYAFFDLPTGAYCVQVVTPEVTVSALVELAPGQEAVDVNLMWPGPP